MNAKTGTIYDTVDAGSVVVVFITTAEGLEVVNADGNLWRKAEELCGPLVSEEVEYTATDWGGLAWFHPVNVPRRTSMTDVPAISDDDGGEDDMHDAEDVNTEALLSVEELEAIWAKGSSKTDEDAVCGSCDRECDGPHYCDDPDEYVQLYSSSTGSCVCECHEFYHTDYCQYGHDDTEENPDDDPSHEQCECGCHRAYEALGWGWLGMDA